MSKKNLVLGILAHVDAGKTTLSEAILYKTGSIRRLGRVDHKTAFLDTDAVERNRGITVLSKEARFVLGEKNCTLLDTPGHVDFSTEMERTLQVIDYAVLVISGAEGVQSHTLTLWKLLDTYNIPTFVFINKMDSPIADWQKVLKDLNDKLGGGFVKFCGASISNEEDAATCSEALMEEYLDKGQLSTATLTKAIRMRQLFPVSFGSALKMEGVDEFLETLGTYTQVPKYLSDFGARVYKITRDKQGNRQAHMKITGGILKNKMVIATPKGEEKVEQIRLYSGTNVENVGEAEAGMICAVTGLLNTRAGDVLGIEEQIGSVVPVIAPAMTYQVIFPDHVQIGVALPKLRQIEEEEPSLKLEWKEALQELHIQVMGPLELDVLKARIKERFDMDISFGEGSIIYKETIENPVIGIGHFEPLKHYAEVHILLEPLCRGGGIAKDSLVREDMLDKNWQRLITAHLGEKAHLGVLTGSPVTDIKFTIIGGRAHLKHTEGGDFRQATYRAVRQGLRKAKSILLEPMYRFSAEVPTENVGRILSDMQRMGAQTDAPQMLGDMAIVTGRGPVATIEGYHKEVAAFTKGKGNLSLVLDGYDRCHNEEEVIEKFAYNPESDMENPTGSVFCQGGSGEYVPWTEVDDRAHVDSGYALTDEGVLEKKKETMVPGFATESTYERASARELEDIFVRTYGKSKRDEALRREKISKGQRGVGKSPESPLPPLRNEAKEKKKSRDSYYVIDGYNVIFAWEQLNELAQVNMDSAREAFLEIMENYRGYRDIEMIIVFDGYKRQGSGGSQLDYGGVKVVYTKEAETADRFIEKTVYELGRKFDITVVTSDRPVQMAALGDGAARMSAREFFAEVMETSEEIVSRIKEQHKPKFQPMAGKFDV